MVGSALAALALLLASPAAAEEPRPESAWDALRAMPPTSAWELAVHASFGRVGFWAHESEPFIGIGVRFGWGRLFGEHHRLGVLTALGGEGPCPLYCTVALEPQLSWDHVRGGLQVGASLGPALMLHSKRELLGTQSHLGVSPMVAARVGYSEPWTRAGRRFFVVAEPKVRQIGSVTDVLVALVVGSGTGN